jgi:hypothetical protein
MARNGSGVYSLPATSSFNPAVTGQSATAADWNTTGTDIAAALTQSISQDGQTTVTANIPFAGFRLTGVGNPVGAQDAVTQAFLATTARSYLAGFTLSNDSGTPNTVLDIAAGSCVDSTNTVILPGTAFTKTTGGSWVAGTGNAGMGSGLSISATTWYHVFAIINNGVYDVYFDTSVTAANKPASTTAFRRIGSFKTDGSSHILAFLQNGDKFQWGTIINETPGSGAGPTLETLIGVPPGLVTTAILGVSMTTTSGLATMIVSTPGVATTPAAIGSNGTGLEVLGQVMVDTNASNQVNFTYTGAVTSSGASTIGWIDRRGRDA